MVMKHGFKRALIPSSPPTPLPTALVAPSPRPARPTSPTLGTNEIYTLSITLGLLMVAGCSLVAWVFVRDRRRSTTQPIKKVSTLSLESTTVGAETQSDDSQHATIDPSSTETLQIKLIPPTLSGGGITPKSSFRSLRSLIENFPVPRVDFLPPFSFSATPALAQDWEVSRALPSSSPPPTPPRLRFPHLLGASRRAHANPPPKEKPTYMILEVPTDCPSSYPNWNWLVAPSGSLVKAYWPPSIKPYDAVSRVPAAEKERRSEEFNRAVMGELEKIMDYPEGYGDTLKGNVVAK